MTRRLPAMALALLSLAPLSGANGPAETALDERIASLSNLVLRQQISRFTQSGNKVRKLESYDSIVNVAEASPEYSDERRRYTDVARARKIDGLWSFGETVTMLRTTRDALAGRALDSREIRFHCPASDRRWFVMVGPVTYWLDFEGALRVSPETGEIERIVWTADSLPPEAGVARIEWAVEFRTVAIAGRLCNVPKTAVYRILRSGALKRAEWNVTEFSEVGRYGSESTIRFDQ